MVSHNGLISKRNQKMWNADPLEAAKMELSSLTGHVVSPSAKQRQKIRDLVSLIQELERV